MRHYSNRMAKSLSLRPLSSLRHDLPMVGLGIRVIMSAHFVFGIGCLRVTPEERKDEKEPSEQQA